MREKLSERLRSYADSEGCDLPAAFRDLLTDAMHIAESLNLDFAERLESAGEVFGEEAAEQC